MGYTNLDVNATRKYCEDIFKSIGYSEQESADIVDVLITADLFGIESHGIQRLIRYHLAIEEGSILTDVKPEIIFQSPISVVFDAPKSMGQIVAKKGMNMAIDMAKKHGIGAVCVRGSNHYGIAGYYTLMAAEQDMLGISMTNTEAIAIPTYGKKAMLGTSPIAVCMPADPVNFWYDAATTVITRGKLEVYRKKELPLPQGWVADENGMDCDDADRKGYGLGIIVELFTSIFAGGTTSPHVRNSGNADTSFCLWAIDYGIFGNKTEIKNRMSTLLRELRESPKADGKDRIYTHGEIEIESRKEKLESGIPVNEKTLEELKMIGKKSGLELNNYFSL